MFLSKLVFLTVFLEDYMSFVIIIFKTFLFILCVVYITLHTVQLLSLCTLGACTTAHMHFCSIFDSSKWATFLEFDFRSAIFEFFLFPFISRLKGHCQNSIVRIFLKQIKDLWKQILSMVKIGKVRQKREEGVIKLKKWGTLLFDGLLWVKWEVNF